MTPFWGVEISVEIGVDSPMTTPLAWVLFSVETSSDGGFGASTGTPWVVAVVEEAMA